MQDNGPQTPGTSLVDASLDEAKAIGERFIASLEALRQTGAIDAPTIQGCIRQVSKYMSKKSRGAQHPATGIQDTELVWAESCKGLSPDQSEFLLRAARDIQPEACTQPDNDCFAEFAFSSLGSPMLSLCHSYSRFEHGAKVGLRVLALLIYYDIQRWSTYLGRGAVKARTEEICEELGRPAGFVQSIYRTGQFYMGLLAREAGLGLGTLAMLGTHHTHFGKHLRAHAAKFAACCATIPDFQARSQQLSPFVLRAVLHCASRCKVIIRKDTPLYDIVHTQPAQPCPSLPAEAGPLSNSAVWLDSAPDPYHDSSYTRARPSNTPIDPGEGSDLSATITSTVTCHVSPLPPPNKSTLEVEVPWNSTDWMVDWLILSCKRGDLDIRLQLARKAHSLTEVGWSVRRASAVLEMSKICRLKGEYEQSMQHLRLFREERGQHDFVEQCLEPRIFIEELENLVQTDQLEAAVEMIKDEESSEESVINLDLQVKKIFLFAKIYRAKGDFVNCRATLEPVVQRPDAMDNVVHRCWLADAYTDLGDYEKAYATLERGSNGRLDWKAMCEQRPGRRILTSLADVHLAAGDVTAAEQRLEILTRAHARLSKWSVADELLDVRTLISHARCGHEWDIPTALRRWTQVQCAVKRHKSFCDKGTPYGISALASCDLYLRTGDFKQAWQHFCDAKTSLSTRLSYYWFPTLSPWTEGLAGRITSQTGWKLGDSNAA